MSAAVATRDLVLEVVWKSGLIFNFRGARVAKAILLVLSSFVNSFRPGDYVSNELFGSCRGSGAGQLQGVKIIDLAAGRLLKLFGCLG